MAGRRVQLPEAEVRDVHVTLHELAGAGARPPVRSGGAAPALGNVNRARYRRNAVVVVVAAAVEVIGRRSPLGELEEEEGVAPPAFLVLLDFLEGFVFGDGLLQLEMEVYGS